MPKNRIKVFSFKTLDFFFSNSYSCSNSCEFRPYAQRVNFLKVVLKL